MSYWFRKIESGGTASTWINQLIEPTFNYLNTFNNVGYAWTISDLPTPPVSWPRSDGRWVMSRLSDLWRGKPRPTVYSVRLRERFYFRQLFAVTVIWVPLTTHYMLANVICPLSNADQPLIAFANILSLENPNNSTLRVLYKWFGVLDHLVW